MLGQYQKIITDETNASAIQKQTLLKTYLQGTIWQRQLFKNPGMMINDIAKNANKTGRYVSRVISFSFMAPDLAARILKGDIPPQTTLEYLVYNWPVSWDEQRKLFDSKQQSRLLAKAKRTAI